MKQPLIVILILLILGGGFGYLFVWPNYQRWNTKKGELQAITGELDDLAKKQSLIKELEGAEPTLSQMSDLALTFIPVEEEREQFAGELDALAQANQLTLTTLTFSASTATTKPAAAAEDSGDKAGAAPAVPATTGSAAPAANTASSAQSLNFNASLIGSYGSVEQFLKKLEQTKRYSVVRTFDVTTTTASAPVATTTSGATPDPAATATPEQQINLNLAGSIFTRPVSKTFTPEQKFSTDLWQYLLDRTTTTPTSSASNPFAPYQ